MRLRQWPAPSHPVEEDAAHSLPRSHCGQWGTHQGRVAADCPLPGYTHGAPSLWHPARPALRLEEHRLLLPRGANSAAQNWLSERVATGRDVGTGTPLSVVQPLSTPARCRSLGAAEASRKTSRWHPPPPPRGTRPRPGTRDRSPDALQTPTCKRTRGAEGRVRQVQKKKKIQTGKRCRTHTAPFAKLVPGKKADCGTRTVKTQTARRPLRCVDSTWILI